MTTYTINRPPVVETFWLPTRDELLSLTPGDKVKIIFERDQGDYPAERMWVELMDTNANDEWVGALANTPIVPIGLDYGDLVRFHPLDVIDYRTSDEGRFVRNLSEFRNHA